MVKTAIRFYKFNNEKMMEPDEIKNLSRNSLKNFDF